jgi:hypothetical protein
MAGLLAPIAGSIDGPLSQRVNRVSAVMVIADVNRRQGALGGEVADQALRHAEQLRGAGGVDGDRIAHIDLGTLRRPKPRGPPC